MTMVPALKMSSVEVRLLKRGSLCLCLGQRFLTSMSPKSWCFLWMCNLRFSSSPCLSHDFPLTLLKIKVCMWQELWQGSQTCVTARICNEEWPISITARIICYVKGFSGTADTLVTCCCCFKTGVAHLNCLLWFSLLVSGTRCQICCILFFAVWQGRVVLVMFFCCFLSFMYLKVSLKGLHMQQHNLAFKCMLYTSPFLFLV